MGTEMTSYPRWKDLDPASEPVVLSLLPGKVVALIFGVAGIAQKRYGKLADATMPDAWLQEVVKAQGLSASGEAFLVSKLEHQHRVSLEDALDWLAIEEAATQAAIRAGAVKKPKKASRLASMKIAGGIKWPEVKADFDLLTPVSDMRTKIGAAALLERAGVRIPEEA